MEELKSCPFCGEKENFMIHRHFIECRKCGCRGRTAKSLRTEDVIKAWNKRDRKEN